MYLCDASVFTTASDLYTSSTSSCVYEKPEVATPAPTTVATPAPMTDTTDDDDYTSYDMDDDDEDDWTDYDMGMTTPGPDMTCIEYMPGMATSCPSYTPDCCSYTYTGYMEQVYTVEYCCDMMSSASTTREDDEDYTGYDMDDEDMGEDIDDMDDDDDCVCPTDDEPVCVSNEHGEDEYTNDCEAKCAGHTMWSDGSCGDVSGVPPRGLALLFSLWLAGLLQ
jgi:hypothetical protein